MSSHASQNQGRPRPRGRSARVLILAGATSQLVGCRADSDIFIQGEAHPEARSVLMVLEQGGTLHIEAGTASLGVPTFDPSFVLPEVISESDDAHLTLVSLGQALGHLGLRQPGPVLAASERTRTLSSLAPLRIERARLFGEPSERVLTKSEPSAGLSAFAFARIPLCPNVQEEFFPSEWNVRELVSVRDDLAVAVSSGSVVVLRPDRPLQESPLPSGEFGLGIGLSRQGVVWVTTSSRAAVFDPESGQLTRSVPMPEGKTARGVFDDEAAGVLYLVSTEIDVWEYTHQTATWRNAYSVPENLVRDEQARLVPARISPTPEPGRFLLIMEEVAGVLDYSAEAQKLFLGERTGAGFPSFARLETGEVLVAESFTGDLYLFDGLEWRAAGQGPAKMHGLAPLSARRWMFITARAVTGVLDLDDPRSCPESAIPNRNNGRNIVRVGDDYWIGVQASQAAWGWGRLKVQLEPHF